MAAVALSVVSTIYYLQQHLILAYQDSFSHLEISRRVVTGMSPGMAQLGDVWLPLPHLLQGLFSWSGTLYGDGLAGSIVSMAAYLCATLFVYRTVRIYSGARAWPAIAGALVFATNVNVLYQQATPMDEIPFYAFTSAAVYYLVEWGQTRDATKLLAASIGAMLASLCRYEGWYLDGIYFLCVIVMARRLGYSWRDVRGLTTVYVVFGMVVSIGSWLLYNLLIFHDPLYFINGPYASAQLATSKAANVVAGHWVLSAKSYGLAVFSDIGLGVILAACVGLVFFLVAERLSPRSLPVLGLLSIIPFFIFALEIGQIPMSAPGYVTLLNYRFGLIVALPASILVGYLFARLPSGAGVAMSVAAIAALAAIALQSFEHHQVVLAREAQEDLWAQRDQIEAANFLASHTSGLILLDIIGNERVDFGLVDRTVYEGTKESGTNQWLDVLKDPKQFGVRDIVMRLPKWGEGVDAVYGALRNSRALRPYHLVYHRSYYLIYQLRHSH